MNDLIDEICEKFGFDSMTTEGEAYEVLCDYLEPYLDPSKEVTMRDVLRVYKTRRNELFFKNDETM